MSRVFIYTPFIITWSRHISGAIYTEIQMIRKGIQKKEKINKISSLYKQVVSEDFFSRVSTNSMFYHDFAKKVMLY